MFTIDKGFGTCPCEGNVPQLGLEKKWQVCNQGLTTWPRAQEKLIERDRLNPWLHNNARAYPQDKGLQRKAREKLWVSCGGDVVRRANGKDEILMC
eukprot:3638211-Rhodomonas_salina.1